MSPTVRARKRRASASPKQDHRYNGPVNNGAFQTGAVPVAHGAGGHLGHGDYPETDQDPVRGHQAMEVYPGSAPSGLIKPGSMA